MPKIRQEVTFAAPPARIYRALMDSAEHAAFTGGPAEISPDEGGSFSCHGGKVVGRNVELVPDKRIVQAWRPADWPEGLYSMVRFELNDEGAKTRLVLDHDGLPEDAVEHISGGWKMMYWEPLEKFLKD
ncbi:MAG: SRPBCC family protein [Deltaproteobacteria bacterium]|nr:SRPBCC family protein [Deltaproteobacteria bacterium]